MGRTQVGLVELDAGEVQAMIADQQAVIVDVREPEEFVAERLPDSLLLPMSSFRPELWPSFPGRRIIITCAAGVRSAAVARKLLTQGQPLVFHLRGGLKAWKAAGLAIES